MQILIVEDEVGIAESLQRGLTADGFDVDLAHTGPDGLDAARRSAHDLIVLDIMLPGMNGYEVCAALRGDGITTPILMLTAKDTDAELASGLDTGADDYVVKPFSYVVLVARIRALLRRVDRADADATLKVGDLEVDTNAHTVRRGSVSIDLSPRAIEVLSHLMRHSGTVVSKASMLASIWDHAAQYDDNIIEVYISRLRQAIDAPFDRSTLQTVRGLGYRLIDDQQ